MYLFLAQGHRYILDTCNKYYYLRVSQLSVVLQSVNRLLFLYWVQIFFVLFFFFFFSYDKNVLQLSLGASVFFHYSLCVVLTMAFLRSGRKTIAATAFKFKFLHEHQTVLDGRYGGISYVSIPKSGVVSQISHSQNLTLIIDFCIFPIIP